MFKNFPSRQGRDRRFEFRAESFNIFNTPQFNNPNAQIGNAAAGTITSAGQPQPLSAHFQTNSARWKNLLVA